MSGEWRVEREKRNEADGMRARRNEERQASRKEQSEGREYESGGGGKEER